ncbi:MAG: bifunctional glutamate N-acetyltransferase/amino-acid acetyltransferase ArgJ [Eubacteriaceae bacterium]|nr:bifunctional glutamate N-acetyltransferase/amino-acid acetyltransferase ArgJ [Eubacteriaceae bacterium]
MKEVSGSICAPAGFKAAGMHCGIKKEKKDLALIVSEAPASAAAVYTTNVVKAAPITVTMEHLADGKARGIIANSGNANACVVGGQEAAEKMCELAAAQLGLLAEDFAVASTGVIGQSLDIGPIASSIGELAGMLSHSAQSAAEAIMTTDTFDKQAACEIEIGAKTVRIGGIAKGSGMIHPNMATMLAFITTDANIGPELLSEILSQDAQDSFNMLSVDGDTSTNDMCAVLANGMAGNDPIQKGSAEEEAFRQGLGFVTKKLARLIAEDGEGATKLLTVKVTGAESKEQARAIAKSIVSSSLVKTAMFGNDANWGRILCAAGYAGVSFPVDRTKISISSEHGSVVVAQNGMQVLFDEAEALKALQAKEVIVDFSLGSGQESAEAWGCDLSYDYVKINGSYRT